MKSGTPRTERKQILVAEDNDTLRHMITKVLERAEFQVDSAQDGQEVVEKCKKNSAYSVILLDVMMPRLTGEEVVEHFREHFPDLVKRVVVMTAAVTKSAAETFGPVCAIISKPFDIHQLVRVVTDCAAVT